MRDIKFEYPYLAFQIFPGWGPLHIIDITTGKQVWNSENSTAVFDLSYNTAFVQLADTATYEAVDLINGSIVWEFEADTPSRLTQIQ
jgi:outer membrane protein assembly factor BamB